MTQPAGWHVDARGVTRWWDGTAWTARTDPETPPRPTPFDPSSAGPPPRLGATGGNTARPWWRKPWAAVLGAAVLVLAIGGVVSGVVLSGSSDGSSGGDAHRAVSDPSSAVSTGSTGSTSSQPTSGAPSTTEPVRTWFAGVSDDLSAVQADAAQVRSAFASGDEHALLHACGGFELDVNTFQTDPLAPDQAVSANLGRAMSSYARSASQCLERKNSQSRENLTRGTGYLTRATARIRELS